MGGLGSGSQPNDAAPRRGRKPKAAISVVGTGSPELPKGLPVAVQKEFRRLAELTQGLSFSQDSDALVHTARLFVREQKLNKLLDKNPYDMETQRILLAIGRQKLTFMGKFGLNPRDRQVLLVPRNDDGESLDPFERMLSQRTQRAASVNTQAEGTTS